MDNYSGPTSTSNSESEGRLKADVNNKKKKSIIRKVMKKAKC